MSTRLQITALGGAQEIGANSYHLRLDGVTLQLDSGMHPKKVGADALPLYAAVAEHPIDALLLSHCHLDHVGSLPETLRRSPHAALYTTEPSVRLAPRMLRNMVNVMRAQQQEIGAPKPLFGFDEVEIIEQILEGVPLSQTIAVRRGLGGPETHIAASFWHAGHILGAAGVLLQSDNFSVFYTGDTCAADQSIIPGAIYPEGPVDLLMMECTAGADERGDHYHREQEIARFAASIRKVLGRGGVVFIPAFALGRTQEMLAMVYQLWKQGQIPLVPIYLSGFGKAISQIYDATRHCSHRIDPKFVLHNTGCFVLETAELEKGKYPKEACIIIATSGMLHPFTPANYLARALLPDPKHGIFFVGYVDPEAPGHRVLTAQAGEEICLEDDGPRYTVRAEIERFHFSAHSSRKELIEMATKLRPKTIFLIHGGRRSLAWMQEALAVESMPDIIVAEPGVCYEIAKKP